MLMVSDDGLGDEGKERIRGWTGRTVGAHNAAIVV